jgi:hypothetical protein
MTYRRCFIDGTPAYFHKWATQSIIYNGRRACHVSNMDIPGGIIYNPVGIVSFEDGSVKLINPENIIFETEKAKQERIISEIAEDIRPMRIVKMDEYENSNVEFSDNM